MSTITRVDGWPVAPGTAAAFLNRLKPAFERAFPGVTLHVYSGYRSYEDQVKIFTERYRRGGHSPFGDYRYWDGSTWGRVSGEGTVAAPGTSNHQSGHALDIRDSGSDAGVTIAGNARSNWIRRYASDFGFNPAGYGFAEPWHIEYIGEPWAAASAGGGGGSEDVMNKDQERKLDKLISALEYVDKRTMRMESKIDDASGDVTTTLGKVAWLAEQRIKGSGNGPSITEMLAAILAAVKAAAEAQGVDAEAVQEAIEEALSDVEIVLTTKGKAEG